MNSISFWGLIAMGMPERSNVGPSAIRALFVKADKHQPRLEVPLNYINKKATTAQWDHSLKLAKIDVARWWLDGAHITFEGSLGGSLALAPKPIKKFMIDVQDASGDPPITDAGWESLPAVEITSGTLGGGEVIKATDGSDQEWGYRSPTSGPSPKRAHPVVKSVLLTTDANVIVVQGGAHPGRIVLEPNAIADFRNDDPTGSSGSPEDDYVFVFRNLFGIYDPAKQFLPYETKPHGSPLRKFPDYDRCPGLAAYRVSKS
jgi:hypothetical protein